MRNFKSVVLIFLILQLLLSWQSIGNTQQVSRPVTYSAEFKPLGDGIDWEASVPQDFESVHLYFKFQVDPGTVETEINGNINFDQDNQTLTAEPRTVTVNGNSYVGKIVYSGGIILSGEIVFDFVIPIPLFPDISIDHSVPIPGFPQINKSWDDEKFFNSLLLADGEAVEVEGGVRKLVSVEITAVEIAELLAVVLSQGTLPQRIADKAGEIIKKYIGDGGISLNGGLKNTFTLSGRAIYVDGQLITEENQTVSIPILDPSLNSYSLHSSYEELFTVRLDFVLSSDVFFNFAPFGIELWSYEKEILEVPIPIVPDTEIDTLDFVTTPDTITFPTKTNEQPTLNRTPVASGPISPQTVRIGDTYTKIDISDKFSDPDGDTLTYLATSSNQNILTLQRVGSEITLLPWAAGNATVTVTATDPNGLSATQTFSVTVQPSAPTTVNRAPESVGTMNTQALYVGGYSSTIDVSSYFHDPDGNTLTYSVTSNNTNIVTAETLNNARIRINPQANGTTTVTVTASDGNLSTTQSFSVTVSTRLIIGNRAPVAQGTISSQTMTVGDPSVTIDVSGYFHDPDGDTLTYSVRSDDRDVVSVQRTGTSSIRLTPEGDGNATVTATASDGRLSVTQTISVTVNSSSVIISDVPDVVVENISADYTNNYPGERYTVSVTVRNAGGRRASSVRVRYYYSDDAVYSTDDEEYENLDDSLGGMDSGETGRESVNLDAPDEQGSYYIIARADRVRNERNTRNNYAAIKITVLPPPVPDLVVTLTARHRNISTLTASSYLIDSNDYFKLIADVRNQGEEDAPDRATVRYYFSTDSIISDDDVEFDTGRIWQLDVGDSDDDSAGLRAPEKPGDYYYYAYVDSVEGESNTDNNYSNVIKVSVRGPDLVIASVSVDYWSGRLTTVGPNGLFRLYATVHNQGTDEASSTTLRYYVSSDDTLSDDDTEIDTDRVHRLDPNETEDEQSNTTNTSYVSGFFYCFVCIDEVDDEIHTDNNCSDPIKITVRNVAPQPQGTITAQTLNIGTSTSFDGSDYFTDANNDTLTYTANSGDNGIVTASASGTQVTLTPKKVGSATVTVTASDGTLTATQAISVSVVEPNRAPVAVGTISARTLTSGASTEEINISANFQDPDNDTLTYTVNSNNTNVATANVSGSQITITPVAVGSATITITASDGKLTAKQTFTVSVVDPNRAPVTVDAISPRTLTVGDSSEQIDVSGNFNDPDNNILTYTASSSATSIATVSVSGAQVTITPVGAGKATITITASDGELTATQTISVTVNAAPVANLAPVTVSAFSYQTLTVEGSPVVLDISGNFNDPDNDTLTYSAHSDNTSAATVSVSGSQITITPVGAGNATITITASDGEFTATQTISVIVTAAPVANRAPVAIGTISARTLTVGDLSVIVNVSANFNDPDGDTLSYTVSSNNTSVATASASGSQVTITPVAAGSATITVTTNDGDLTATQTISVIVTAAPVVNRAPVTVEAISARILTMDSSPIQIDVSGNFQDPDGNSLSYTASSNNTSAATVSVSGSQITITPRSVGSVTITVTASDGELTATQTIAVTVTTGIVSNRAPITVGVISSQTLTFGDSSIQIDVSANFQDPDDDTLTYTVSSTALDVATTSVSGSQVTITPVGTGKATITVIASDGKLTATQTIVVTVNDAEELVTNLPEETWMPDTILRTNVRSALELQESETLTQQTMTKLTSLSISAQPNAPTGVVNLTGLEHATQLKTLTLSNYFATASKISDITPLQNLTSLTDLNLGSNSISDITPLKNLTNLTRLILQYNGISDLTPLGNLTKLKYLSLISNQISDVTPIENLTSLTELYLGSNQITNLDPLRRLKTKNPLMRIDIEIGSLTPNRAPTAVGTISGRTLTAGGSNTVLDVSGNFSDADNDTLTYTASSNATGVATVSVSGAQVTITPLAAGSATITVTASDGTLTATQTIAVTVSAAPVANSAPVTVGAISARTLTVGDSAVQIDVSDNFSDPDNDILTYIASSNATGVATVSVSGAQVTITPVAAGSATITVTASDGTLTATQTIAVTVNATVPEETWMPDAVLRAKVRSSLGVQSGDALTQQAMTGLTSLSANSLQISDLTGLEHATNVTSLRLDSNEISDLTPLQNLTKLTYISLYSNPISSVTPLQNLTKLTNLTFGSNTGFYAPIPIGNITPLQNLTELTRLTLRNCQISDITPLQNLTKLTNLTLDGNSISDITPLQNLTELTSLNAEQCSISDITPLQNLTKLTGLRINGNSISDITPLQNLTKLTNIWLRNNSSISDITALQNLTKLTSLHAEGCSISDITPLQNLTEFTILHLGSNQISDITPLQNLTKLVQLELRTNQISDITTLESLTALSNLYVSQNPISDYAPLNKLKAANSNLNLDVNLNNNIPTFTEGDSTTRTVAENTASGVNIGDAISATDADNHTLVYSLSGTDAESFSIVSNSGQLQTSAALDYETKTSYSVIVTVYDGNSGGDTITVTINVTDDVNGAPAAQADPTKTALMPNYPNPFNPETWIPYQLAKPADVALTIYNVSGVVIRELALGHRAAGVYYSRNRAAHWDGRNKIGEKVATGLYFVKFKAGDYTATRKMLIRK